VAARPREPLLGFSDYLYRAKLHAADQSQTEVAYEELSYLVVGKISTGQIQPESLGSQPAAADKRNIGVEVGAVFGHSEGV
jgi:hypothetical protein